MSRFFGCLIVFGVVFALVGVWISSVRIATHVVGVLYPGQKNPVQFPMDWTNYNATAVEPYVISVSDSEIADLRHRLDIYREWESTVSMKHSGAQTWQWGIPQTNVSELVTYWRTAYDWHYHEAMLNDDLFSTNISGLRIVFKYLKASSDDMVQKPPILLLHGWPGSIIEFKVIQRHLVHMGYSVVIPFLPGFGFSAAPQREGFDLVDVAITMHRLMDQLGYAKFIVQGGDWGAMTLEMMVMIDPSRLVGVHTNFPLAMIPETLGTALEVLLFDDPVEIQRAKAQFDIPRVLDMCGYMLEQSTRPETIGTALNDSPAGLLAWIVEKFHGWSDTSKPLLSKFDQDDLLTNVMLYWIANTSTSSARYYKENLGASTSRLPRALTLEWPSMVPVGAAVFPFEMMPMPSRYVSAKYKTKHINNFSRGGHFAALEEPELLISSFSSFLAKLPDCSILDSGTCLNQKQ